MKTLSTLQSLILNIVLAKKVTIRSHATLHYDRELEKALHQQKMIGFQQIWKGIMTQKFGDIQENVYRSGEAKDAIYSDNGKKTQLTGTFWARRIVKIFLTYFEHV